MGMSNNNRRPSQTLASKSQSSSNRSIRAQQAPPPPEIFEIGRSVQDDSDEDSLESVASRISAWADGAEETNDGSKLANDGLQDVLLDGNKRTATATAHTTFNPHRGVDSDNASVMSEASGRSTTSSVSRGSMSMSRGSRGKGSRRQPSLRDVTRVSMTMDKRNSTRSNMSRNQPPRRHSRNVKLSYPSPRSSAESSELERVTEAFNEKDRELDTEAQKFDSIASKYMWDIQTEDETLSSMTIRDINNKRRLMVFCYIATFAAFGFGVLVAYSMFQSGRPPAAITEPPLQSPASQPPMFNDEDIIVENIMPYLQKMSGPQVLNDDASPQNNALEWLQSKDTFTSTSTDQLIQRYVLAAFYYATKGSSAWDHQTNWLTPVNECSWDGITCFDENAYPDVAHFVSKISPSNYGVSGNLPQEIGYLSHLRNLTLESNDISGPLPSTITKLTNLLALNLRDNKIDGELPKDMDQFKSLLCLHMPTNKLNGKIPPGLGNIKSLQSINLKENELTGILPLEFLNLKELKQLNLAKNDLVGVIPKDIDNLVKLQKLNLANNGLFGQIPDTIGNIETLQEINLSNNMFNGYLPASIAEIENLRELDLVRNEFDQGQSMPSEICMLQLDILTADCAGELEDNYVECDCCTSCEP